MDVDPIAHEKAQARIRSLCGDSSHLKAHTFMRNFKNIKSVLREVDEELLSSGVDGILMDLGMSSMQVCFLSQFYCCYVKLVAIISFGRIPLPPFFRMWGEDGNSIGMHWKIPI